MNTIPRAVILVAGLLAFPIEGAMAQQNNQSTTDGATLKSTAPGNPPEARSSAPASTASGGSTLKETTVGDTSKKTVDGSHGAHPAASADKSE
jgi:hypothetical protein